jgi:hypothetical protein
MLAHVGVLELEGAAEHRDVRRGHTHLERQAQSTLTVSSAPSYGATYGCAVRSLPHLPAWRQSGITARGCPTALRVAVPQVA